MDFYFLVTVDLLVIVQEVRIVWGVVFTETICTLLLKLALNTAYLKLKLHFFSERLH